MTATCPVCDAPQDHGLMCATDTLRLEQTLRAIPELVRELDVAISKQAKIGTPGKGGLAREKSPVNFGAIAAKDDLTNTLTTWARDVGSDDAAYAPQDFGRLGVRYAARYLEAAINRVRRHPAVAELVDEITDATTQARRAIDRPADRQYLGKCDTHFEAEDDYCDTDLYAKPDATTVRCAKCLTQYEVEPRRGQMLNEAGDLLLTIKEAAQVIGSFGDKAITESTIRNYVSSGQIVYHGKVDGAGIIRLGDLLDIIRKNAARTGGRKLRRLSTDTVAT